LILQIVLIPVFAVTSFTQPSSGGRRSPADTRRMINNDTYRELLKGERESRNAPTDAIDKGRLALLRQMRDDFKSIQEINNRMMASTWSQEQIDYLHTATMIADINERATRLKSNLGLPDGDKAPDSHVTVTDAKQFKSVLLLMDRTLMNFVKNPIFQDRSVVEVDLATRASTDLDTVIRLSASLKKIAGNLKNSTAQR
jgi:hypothetical protein